MMPTNRGTSNASGTLLPMIEEIDIPTFAARRAAGQLVVDVREPVEYEEAHVPGAVLIPLGEVHDRVDEFPEGEPVLLICRSGGRSLRAAEVLAARGRTVVNVAGGTLAWIDAGHDVASGMERG